MGGVGPTHTSEDEGDGAGGIYIYIYIEERDRERERELGRWECVCVCEEKSDHLEHIVTHDTSVGSSDRTVTEEAVNDVLQVSTTSAPVRIVR